MTLQDAVQFVSDHDAKLLGLLAEYRMAVYRNSLAVLLPYETRQEKQAASDVQARASLAFEAVEAKLHDLLTEGATFEIFDAIAPEEVVRRLAELPSLNESLNSKNTNGMPCRGGTRQLDENGEAR